MPLITDNTPPAWFAVVPVLPLARSVPVVHARLGRGVVYQIEEDEHRIAFPHGAGGSFYASFWPDDHAAAVVNQRLSELRVDLEDPQGYHYADRALLRMSVGYVGGESPLRAAVVQCMAAALRGGMQFMESRLADGSLMAEEQTP